MKKQIAGNYCLKALFQGSPNESHKFFAEEIFYAPDSDINRLGYRTITGKLVPGHAHFPLILFYKKYPNFKYYWFIEYDVKFTGNWKQLLEICSQNSCDFMAAQFLSYSKDPNWLFWEKMDLKDGFERKEPVRSLNPICRLSNRALKAIMESQEQGSLGHNESLLATVVLNAGLSTGQIPKMFFNSICDGCGFHPFETHRPGPEILIAWRRNKIYHPIKSKSGRWLAILRKSYREFIKKIRHIIKKSNIDLTPPKAAKRISVSSK